MNNFGGVGMFGDGNNAGEDIDGDGNDSDFP